MGLRDKFRSKKSGDKGASGRAPAHGAAEPPPHPSAAPVAPVPERVRPMPSPQQRRAAAAAESKDLQTEREVMDQIKELKAKMKDEEKRRTYLETKKSKALGEISALRALPVLDKPKHDRIAREVGRTKKDIEDVDLRIRNMEETIAMMEQRLLQKRDVEQNDAVISAAKKLVIPTEKVEQAQEERDDLISQTQEVRTIMQQMPAGQGAEIDEDDLEQELALHQQNERLLAEKAAAQATPGAIAAIQGADATPTSVPGPLASTVVATSANEEEEGLKRLEQQMAM